ncbi:MAG TPA: ECF transporter S component [Clostridiales bacterium]|nr:ECF transporter S component [Clostridiales bacterium]
MKNRTVRLTTGGLLLAIGVALPVGFHFWGGQLGRVFLPMHICVFLGGMLLGPAYGCGMGLIVPVISFMISQMPGIPNLFFIMAELFLYGLISGVAHKYLNPVLSLIIAQTAGRVVYGFALFVTGNLLGLPVPAADGVITAFVTGLPGIAIQLVIIPAIVFILKKGGFFNGKAS